MATVPLGPTDIGAANQDTVLRGDLVLRDANNVDRIRLDRESGSVFIRDSSGQLVCHLEMPGLNLRLGGHGRDGDLLLFRRTASNLADDTKAVLNANADTGTLRLGADGVAGQIVCRDATNQQTVFVDGAKARVVAGANGVDGTLEVQDADARRTVLLRGDAGRIEAGGNGQNGELRLQSAKGDVVVRLRAQGGDPGPVGTLDIGSEASPGALRVHGSNGDAVAHISPTGVLTLGLVDAGPPGRVMLNGKDSIGIDMQGDGSIKVGAAETGAWLRLFRAFNENPSAGAVIEAHADSGTLRVGGGGGSAMRGLIDVRNEFDLNTILIDGEAGDITFANGDLAEEYLAADTEAPIEPGSVLVLDDKARLCLCRQANDPRVAGICAGAGSARPGIVLGRQETRERAVPLALTGRVYCRVDAREAPVAVGDLLTTSTTPGHAMRVGRGDRPAPGTVVGKALGALAGGTGLVPVMVMLR